VRWHVDTKTNVRYLRIWVSGKTGGRWLIQAAVRMFEEHPHVSTVPEQGVEVVEILPVPRV
jgi:hypothetical protein